MGFGPNPAEVRAAEAAALEARERLASKPLTPFETELLSVLGEIRDALKAAGRSDGVAAGSGHGGGSSRRGQPNPPTERSKQCLCGRQIYYGLGSRKWVHADDATEACPAGDDGVV